MRKRAIYISQAIFNDLPINFVFATSNLLLPGSSSLVTLLYYISVAGSTFLLPVIFPAERQSLMLVGANLLFEVSILSLAVLALYPAVACYKLWVSLNVAAQSVLFIANGLVYLMHAKQAGELFSRAYTLGSGLALFLGALSSFVLVLTSEHQQHAETALRRNLALGLFVLGACAPLALFLDRFLLRRLRRARKGRHGFHQSVSQLSEQRENSGTELSASASASYINTRAVYERRFGRSSVQNTGDEPVVSSFRTDIVAVFVVFFGTAFCYGEFFSAFAALPPVQRLLDRTLLYPTCFLVFALSNVFARLVAASFCAGTVVAIAVFSVCALLCNAFLLWRHSLVELAPANAALVAFGSCVLFGFCDGVVIGRVFARSKEATNKKELTTHQSNKTMRLALSGYSGALTAALVSVFLLGDLLVYK